MPTLLQIASILAERAGKKTDITFIEQMKDEAVIKNGRFLANRLEKNPAQDKYYTRSFDIHLVAVDKDNECAGLQGCGKIMKSTTTIPDPVKYGSTPFSYVGSPGGADPYGWTTFGNEPYMQMRPLTGKKPRYTWRDKYIYVFNKDIERITVEGVFADPRLIAPFRKCNGSVACYDELNDAFIDEQTAELILKDILMTDLRIIPNNEKTTIKTDKDV